MLILERPKAVHPNGKTCKKRNKRRVPGNRKSFFVGMSRTLKKEKIRAFNFKMANFFLPEKKVRYKTGIKPLQALHYSTTLLGMS